MADSASFCLALQTCWLGCFLADWHWNCEWNCCWWGKFFANFARRDLVRVIIVAGIAPLLQDCDVWIDKDRLKLAVLTVMVALCFG